MGGANRPLTRSLNTIALPGLALGIEINLADIFGMPVQCRTIALGDLLGIGEENDLAESNPEIVTQVQEYMDRRSDSDIDEWNFAKGAM